MLLRLHEFLRFCLVGGVGFVVDAGLLEFLVSLGLSAWAARILSIALALQVTYLMHGAFTFRDHGGYSRARWLAFLSCNALGAAINYLLFLAVLMLAPFGEPFLDRQSALITGTAVALFCNYWMNRRFVFRKEDA